MMLELPVGVGQIIAGKYRLDRAIGSGGMGVVVAAWHLELDQPVAIKFLNVLDVDRTDAIERFRREARAAARIRSEHVARVIDVGITEERLPFMVMELLEGNDLAEEILRRGMVPVPIAVGYVLQAVEALAEAHAAGIVHRDLKPANLYLSQRPDGSRFVKVLDFGISKSLTKSSSADLALTKTSVLVGSPLYMSPEHMRSAKDVDLRTDIWSLGAILYELITGRPPYLADSIPQLCASLLSDRPPPMSDFCSELPDGLEAVILRCLEKDASKRFQNVSDLASALVPFAPMSRVHAERARRVLNSVEITLSGANNSDTGPFGAGAMLHSGARTSDSAERASAAGSNPTFASWGGTGAVADRKRRRRRSALLVAGAGLLTIAGGLFAAVRLDYLDLGSGPEALPISGSVTTVVGAARPSEPKEEPALTVQPPEPQPVPAKEPARAADVQNDTAASSPPGLGGAPGSASRPTPVATPPAYVPTKSLAQKPRAPSAKPAVAPRDTLPDFGGRR
jgi:serine/threonine-protein kinase